MDGLEALKCMRNGGVVETSRYPYTVFRFWENSLQIKNKGSDLWIDIDTPASVFLGDDDWTVASKYDLTFAEAMTQASAGATVKNSANPNVLYKMKDGVLWCMDACSFTVEGLTKDEIEARWTNIGRR